MRASALLLVAGILGIQEPGENLERSLVDPDPSARREAAEAIAGMAAAGEQWVLREAGKGTRTRQRAILLAAGLLGTPQSLEVIDRSTRKASRRDPQRAWALLMAGCFHPSAAENAVDWLKRSTSDFETCCLLAGLLAQAQRVEVDQVGRLLAGNREVGVVALRNALMVLAARRAAGSPAGLSDLAGRWITSQVPGAEPIPADWLRTEAARALPALWRVGAYRQPHRGFDALLTDLSGEGGSGVALALPELTVDRRQMAFEYLDPRLIDPQARAWLWGSAGARGLELPEPEVPHLEDAEVAGIVSLAQVDFSLARAAARNRSARARQRLASRAVDRRVWPAAVVLALAGDAADLPAIEAALRRATPEARELLQPAWLLALGRFESAEAREPWLRRWGRALGAGRAGWLDREGPLWVASVLAGESRAARERTGFADALHPLQGPRDHSDADELFGDLLEYLLSEHYRWDLP